MITPGHHNIFFYWDGHICESRLTILRDCVYSTRVFNPHRPIYVVTKTLTAEHFDPKFNIKIFNWDISMFLNTPFPLNKLQYYFNNVGPTFIACNPREVSDLMRLCILYNYGGSYIDTDDIAIKSIGETKNIICRSYDPHTCHYNNLTKEDCIPGTHREIPGYNDITMFPRNDCWLNFEPKHHILHEILDNPKLKTITKVVYIGDGFSFQSLTLEACMHNLHNMGVTFNIGLTLLYLYEDFVSASSYWDRCMFGGEMCDLYKLLPDVDQYQWGFYQCTLETATNFYNTICEKYPMLSHMWLHSKDMKEEWMLTSLNIEQKYSLSTWIYELIRIKIRQYS